MIATLQKTYQGGTTLAGTDLVNQTMVMGDARTTLFAIKQALTTMDQNPWTVIGSSNAVTSGMDAVDRWANAGDLVYRSLALSNMSWIVLQQTGISGTFQMLLALEDSLAADPGRENINISFSTVGYGVANGGTDGAINSSPTSGGGSFGLNAIEWHGAEAGVDTDKVLSVIQSTDGAVTRIVISQKSSGIPVTAIGIEAPRSPNPSWATPAVAYILKQTVASGLNCFRWETIQDTELFNARITLSDASVLAVDLRFTGPMRNASEMVDENQAVGANPFFYGGNLIYDGRDADFDWGSLFDCYWVSRAVGGAHAVDLDTFPAAGNRTFVCVGDLVWGWLDDSTTDLSYT